MIRPPSWSGWTRRWTSANKTLDKLISASLPGGDAPREVLEAYRMVAQSSGWLTQVRDAINDGLTAETAVDKVAREPARTDAPHRRPLSARAAGRYRGHGEPADGRTRRHGAETAPAPKGLFCWCAGWGRRICWIGMRAALPAWRSRRRALPAMRRSWRAPWACRRSPVDRGAMEAADQRRRRAARRRGRDADPAPRAGGDPGL